MHICEENGIDFVKDKNDGKNQSFTKLVIFSFTFHEPNKLLRCVWLREILGELGDDLSNLDDFVFKILIFFKKFKFCNLKVSCMRNVKIILKEKAKSPSPLSNQSHVYSRVARRKSCIISLLATLEIFGHEDGGLFPFTIAVETNWGFTPISLLIPEIGR